MFVWYWVKVSDEVIPMVGDFLGGMVADSYDDGFLFKTCLVSYLIGFCEIDKAQKDIKNL